MAAPKFLQRVARLPEVLHVLSAYPDGLTLAELADQFDVDVETMREDLVTYVELESWGWDFQIFRRPALEFVQPDPDHQTIGEGATIVRVMPDAAPGLGADHLSAGDLATLYTAGAALLDVDPDAPGLASALEVIAETMYGGPATTAPYGGDWNRHVGDLQAAQEQRHKVRIVYSRAWRPGVTQRVIEPLRLVQTHRGWEVDAGPVGEEGNLRTFLLSNIRSLEVLDETFAPPSWLEDRLARQRETTTVRVQLAQDARWAARLHAEKARVVEEDEETFTADLDLLPPVGERLGLILLTSGPSARVLSPGAVLPAALGLVEELLEHHESADPQ